MRNKDRVVKVEIFDREYSLRATVEDDEYIRAISSYVDSKMREIQDSMGIDSSQKIAILAALNIADELFSLQNEKDRLVSDYHEKVRSYTEALEQSLSD
ncbi:MAG: cell division protein ZapA [Candidatus Electryonea clarkiae]|nr:cell division protein ZapA [Candidatus Electryonea clarkiae]MDP8287167.1 cell division protein ZapA [Candidatus Electryonea clarkiae]